MKSKIEVILGVADKVTVEERASTFVDQMEDAVALNRVTVVKAHQDNMLRLARESEDSDLVRRATLIVLKIRSASD